MSLSLSGRRGCRPSRWLHLLALLLPVLLGSASVAAENGPLSNKEMAELGGYLDRVDRIMSAGASDRELAEWLAKSSDIHGRASACIDSTDQELKKTDGDLATLGSRVEGEAREVTEKRDSLQRSRADADKRMASCRLLLLRSDDTLKQVKALQQTRLAERLLARGPTVVMLLRDGWQQTALWYRGTEAFLLGNSGLNLLSGSQRVALLLLTVVELALGLALRRRVAAWGALQRRPATLAAYLGRAPLAVGADYAPQLLISGGIAIFLYSSLPQQPLPFITIVALGLPMAFLLAALTDIFVSRQAAEVHAVHLEPAVAASLNRWLKWLVVLILLGYLLFSTILAQSLPGSALLLGRALFSALLIVNLVRVAWLLGNFRRLEGMVWLRPFFVLVLLATLVAEWLGYRNLSSYLLRGMVGTLLFIGAVILAKRLMDEFFEALDQGERLWAKRLRGMLGQTGPQPISGLGWLRSLVVLGFWSLALLGLLVIWGMKSAGFQQLYGYAVSGFAVGSLKVVPARIAFALIVLGLLLLLRGWIHSSLERRWLPKSRMDRGAREAMATLSNYAGVAVAVLVALSVAGMDFSNLAIIAGALSVGIGFGLQNIVNNFVSGLILLFERPIKTGDWVVVGETEGYVRRISIRSTQIQTFDHADVIVPNSDLISNQVTNWMLHNNTGRLRLPVGVAYGSDTELVKRLLLEVAEVHPLVVTDGSVPKPVVLFRSFGDSSLDFELRCFIANVDSRLSTMSDLNFAVDKAFREHGVEIPFPQRDLHLRDLPKGFGGEAAGRTGERPDMEL